MPEVTHAGEDHRHTWPVGSRDHQRWRVNFRRESPCRRSFRSRTVFSRPLRHGRDVGDFLASSDWLPNHQAESPDKDRQEFRRVAKVQNRLALPSWTLAVSSRNHCCVMLSFSALRSVNSVMPPTEKDTRQNIAAMLCVHFIDQHKPV